MPKLIRILSITVLLLGINLVYFTPQNVYAFQDPTFTVTSGTATPGAAEDITLGFEEPVGSEFGVTKVFRIPAGWDVAGGDMFIDNTVLGTGSFTGVIGGGLSTFPMTILNDSDLQGHKAHWKFSIAGGAVVLDSFVDGDINGGYSFSVTAPVAPIISTPTSSTFTLNGSVDGTTFMTNPTVAGDYVWEADFITSGGATITKQATISVPGTLTPTGNDVAVDLPNSVSVIFNSVTTAGVTTLTTTPTAPPAGTGQFQLSGGLYFDFNSSAEFSCPCTVTLPYDPIETPNPRIYHMEDSVWLDVTTSVNTLNNTVTGVVSSFSFFAAGEPSFGLEFIAPVSALLEKSNPMQVENESTLPVNFVINDASDNFISRNDVSVQVVNNSTNVLVSQISAQPLKKHYKANLNLKDLNLANGTYKLRVKVGNTTYTPVVLFQPI
ncbi:MAG: hypothetical protein UR98_C0015G0001 [Parcubacteria group bacterium GW2011_GWA1_36_12]|nr:MAG: hypothetical protein UR98_C0015G0001 [Parcubacteria group bacterium GW2011_GWA1_36_12]